MTKIATRPLRFETLDTRQMLAAAPEWSTTVGGQSYEEARAVVPAVDGGFVSAGWTYTKNGARRNEDFFVAKVDAQGNEEWTRSVGGNRQDRAYSIANAGKGYVVAGRTQSFGRVEKGFVVRLDPQGKVIWKQTYGNRPSTGIRNIAATKDGGFIATGWTGNIRHDDTNDTFLLKLSAGGEIEWFRTYDAPYWQTAHEVIQAPDRGYVVAGAAQTGAGGSETFDGTVMKTDAQGNVQWTITNGKSYGWDEWHGVTKAAGGYVFSGGTEVDGKLRTWLMRTDAVGNILWERTYREYSYSWHVDAIPQGGFVATGAAVPLKEIPRKERAERRDGFLLVVDDDGRTIASSLVGGRYHDEARYVLAISPDEFVLVGYMGLERGKRPSSNHQPKWDRNLWIAEYSLRSLRRS